MKNHHELVIFENGRISLKDLALDEAMHSKIGPWEEAHSIYIAQSNLSNRLQVLEGNSEPLVLFDIGLGLAANSLAALHCRRQLVEAGKKVRKLRIVSFENDPEGLKLALKNREQFPFFEGFENLLEELLSKGFWKSPAEESSAGELFGPEVTWELCLGDFQNYVENGFGQGLNSLHPEVIFYDFYSPKSQPQLWQVEYFAALRRAAHPHAILVTYSVATAVRVAMVLGGFYMGQGVRTPAKLETTVAACRTVDLAHPLGSAWIDKLRRSTKIFPFGYEEADRDRILVEAAKALSSIGS